MDLITLDFETYYSADYGLRKFTTEEYIRHKSFEVIGVSVKVNSEEAVWFSGTKEQTKRFLDGYNWSCVAIAHNAVFDMAILNWHFDIRPKRIADTLSMARALHGTEVGGSLDALVTHYGLGVKGKEVLNALGKHRIDFTAEELERYGGYCKNDSELTHKLFKVLGFNFPVSELRLIDLTVRMFTEPTLSLDAAKLTDHLANVQIKKAKLMERLKETKADLLSNLKFAELLKLLGVEPPMKISPANGKDTYAFAKSDEAFKALLEHENTYVQTLVAARLGVKSTLEETRTERFIGIAKRGLLPIPLRYYAAHTGRWGGDDKVNMQNLTSRGGNANKLKNAICAPDGYRIIDSDSSQIEARVLAWLSGQEDLVEDFSNNNKEKWAGVPEDQQQHDVYKIMAASIYNKPIAEVTKDERFVGKTTILGCIGAGTQVLCDSGWKPIEQVTRADKLWDGEEWVCHQGLLTKGLKQTLNLCGVWLTPDHKVLSGTQWLEAQLVVQDESILCQALATGVENLPLLATSQGKGTGSRRLSYGAIADYLSTQLTTKTLRTLRVLAAMFVPRRRRTVNAIGSMLTPCTTTHTVFDYLTGYQQRSQGATTLVHPITAIMGGGVSKFLLSGERIGQRFLGMYRPLKVGTSKSLKWIGSTITKGTSWVISGLHLGAPTCKTDAKCQPLSKNLQTYDIAYSGPRNRFTILTERGPILVHNCGYGMGAPKFKAQLKTFGVDITEEQASGIIHVYRETYPKIPALWRQASRALEAIKGDQSAPIGLDGVLIVRGTVGIQLPNGLYLKYPNLRDWANSSGKLEQVYDTKKGKALIPNRIYGGKVIENVCQALARIVIGEQMLAISKRYKVVMTVHDAIACLVPTEEADAGKVFVEDCMKVRPKWAQGLPLNCEAGVGSTYGDTK